MSEAKANFPATIHKTVSTALAADAVLEAPLALVVTGNVQDGFKFYGPFRDVDQATTWVEKHGQFDQWDVVDMIEPDPKTLEGL